MRVCWAEKDCFQRAICKMQRELALLWGVSFVLIILHSLTDFPVKPQTEVLVSKDGLNLYLADAKVQEGGKEMGYNIYWAPPIVASHGLTHSILKKWHQTWWNPPVRTTWSALCLHLAALLFPAWLFYVGSLRAVARWPPAALLSHPPSFASPCTEDVSFLCLYSNLWESQTGLVLSHVHD